MIASFYPFRTSCEQCANEQTHHHIGLWTKGMPHEASDYYCWCLDKQAPKIETPEADAHER